MPSTAQVLVGSCCTRNKGDKGIDEFGDQVSLCEEAPIVAADTRSDSAKGYPYPRRKEHFLKEDASEDEHYRRGAAMSSAQLISSLATVTVALMVFFYEAATYNIIFLGRILPARDKGALIVPFLVLFNSAWALALWSYLQAHRADPGTLPREWREFVRNVGDALPVAPARLEWQPGKATWCRKCSIPRPERAHHCHVCGVCVLRMDHHCPYIFNCVGFHNHKFFLLLVNYSSLTCFIAIATTLPELVYCMAAVLHVQAGFASEDRLRTSEVLGFLIFGFLALFLALLLFPMVPAHLSLAARNQTSIEGSFTNMPNPFDQGDVAANLAQVFGSYGLEWFLPVRPSRPLSDGISFLHLDERSATPGAEDEQGGQDLGIAEEAEQRWRLRYHVRRQGAAAVAAQAAQAREDSRAESGPMDLLAQWWGRNAELRRAPAVD